MASVRGKVDPQGFPSKTSNFSQLTEYRVGSLIISGDNLQLNFAKRGIFELLYRLGSLHLKEI